MVGRGRGQCKGLKVRKKLSIPRGRGLKSPHPQRAPGPRHFKAGRNQFDSTRGASSGNQTPWTAVPAGGFTPGHAVFRVPASCVAGMGVGDLARGHGSPASSLSALWPEAAPAQGRRGLGDLDPAQAPRLRGRHWAPPAPQQRPGAWIVGLGKGDPTGPPTGPPQT